MLWTKILMSKAMGKPSRLPKEYVECDFLENFSTTKNYIDTGILLNTNMRIESQVMVTDINNSGTCRPIGAYSGAVLSVSKNGQFYPNDDSSTFFDVNLGDKLNVVLRTSTSIYCKVNGAEYSASWSSADRNKYSIRLFNTYSSNSSYYSCGCKIYETKIYDNNALISDLVPCYRVEDNEGGYYDTVRNVFLTNSGTGSIYAGYDDFDKTYTKVEYIRSLEDGVYMGLNKYGTQDTEIYIKVKYHVSGAARRTYGYYSTDATESLITLYSNTAAQSRFGAAGGAIRISLANNVIYEIIQNKNGIYYANGSVLLEYEPQENFKTSGLLNLYGFNGSSYRVSRISVYEFTITENGVEIMHLIPCIHKQSGKAVFYDTVQNKTFYVSGQSETKIEIGPEI